MNKSLTPIILIILAVGLFFTYTNSTWQEVKVLKASSVEYDKAIDQSKQLLKIRDGLLAKFNGFREDDLRKLEKFIPTSIDNVRLIIDINNITSKYGASLQNVKLSTDSKPGAPAAPTPAATQAAGALPVVEVPDRSLNSMVLSFAIKADYATFLSILEELERSLRILDVTSIAFTSTEGEPYTYTISVKTYWLK